MRRLFSTGRGRAGYHQKREAAKDKRRNEAREFGVNGVRAKRANHEGDQGRRSGLSPLGNQHTEPTEDFQHSDDILSVCRVAPIHEPFGPSDRRGAFEFQNPAKTNATAKKMAHAHTVALGSVITVPLRSTSRSAREMSVLAFDHPTRTVSTHKISIPPLNLSSA